MTDQTISYSDPAPGVAQFHSESWGGPPEVLYSDTPAISSQSLAVVGAIDLPIFSVINRAGALATFTPGVAANEDITFTGTGVAAETVTVAGVVYTMAAAPATANEVKIGADATESAENLVAAIMASAGDAGTLYGVGTVENPFVTAANAAGVVTITAKEPGTGGNAITLATDSATDISVGAATLSSGTAASSDAYAVLATDVDIPAGASAHIPVYRTGHFNGGALNWDGSFSTEGAQKIAFEGTNSPNILVSHKRFSDNDLAV